MLREKKSIIDLLTGGKDLPIKTDVQFEKESRDTIIAGISILAISGILIALILRKGK